MDEKKAPMFIIGTGRCGSTIFHKIFSEHPNVSWFSFLLNKHPNKPHLNRLLLRTTDIPFFGDMIKNRITPGECYNFWNYYYPGFRRPCRDLKANDVTKNIKNDIREIFSQIPTKNRKRVLVKITGWPRIGFLKEIFPNAKFIHILRDGRAVVNSMLNVDWWWGWKGPNNWRWGELTESEEKLWKKNNKSFIALAAIEWIKLIKAVEESKNELRKNQFMEIKYEDLCENKKKIFKNTTEFCDLEYPKKFDKQVSKYQLENRNYKWKENFSPKQKEILMDVLEDHLEKYDYLCKNSLKP